MRCKLLTAAVVALVMLTTGCSTLEKVVYRPDINQGNFLTPTEVAKLQEGMSKQQVIYLLGTPLVQDPFGSDTWFYIFRQQPAPAVEKFFKIYILHKSVIPVFRRLYRFRLVNGKSFHQPAEFLPCQRSDF